MRNHALPGGFVDLPHGLPATLGLADLPNAPDVGQPLAPLGHTLPVHLRALLRTDLAQTPASALIAYVDGEPAGWVKVSPRPDQPRLALTKAFQQSPEPFDDTSVWAISCFVVRREHRGVGLAAEHLARERHPAAARAHRARHHDDAAVDRRDLGGGRAGAPLLARARSRSSTILARIVASSARPAIYCRYRLAADPRRISCRLRAPRRLA